METKTCLNDVSIHIKDNILILEREMGFFSLDTFNSGIGIGDIRSIITYIIKSPEESIPSNLEDHEETLKNISKEFEVFEPATTAIGNYDLKNNVNKTLEDVSVIVNAGKSIDAPLNITVLINRELDEPALIDLFQSVVEIKTTIFCDFGVENYSPDYNSTPDNSFSRQYDSKPFKDEIIVAGTSRGEVKSPLEMDEIRQMVSECVHEALKDILKNFGYPLSIIDHIKNVGITIEDLIDAGMQLCVGVERTVKLDIKLKKQLHKSLGDLNVAALIMAGIRLEEDLARHRIRGINVDDDPAYLYSDEVLGMAVANQIAGTKAIFNFKRYDEEKPGVIGKLGPVLDDVFAGLVAGCMSKIFEE